MKKFHKRNIRFNIFLPILLFIRGFAASNLPLMLGTIISPCATVLATVLVGTKIITNLVGIFNKEKRNKSLKNLSYILSLLTLLFIRMKGELFLPSHLVSTLIPMATITLATLLCGNTISNVVCLKSSKKEQPINQTNKEKEPIVNDKQIDISKEKNSNPKLEFLKEVRSYLVEENNNQKDNNIKVKKL